MSDLMLHGVLNMPPELWGNHALDKMQRYSRYMEASRRIEDLNRAMKVLIESNNNWRMSLDVEQENHVQKMLDIIE
jgi:hypothetical protein